MSTQPSNSSYSISYEIMERLSEELTDNEVHINTEIEQGDVLVVFDGNYSVDGTLRTAKGTLKEVNHLIKGTGSNTPSTLRYFDVEAQSSYAAIRAIRSCDKARSEEIRDVH